MFFLLVPEGEEADPVVGPEQGHGNHGDDDENIDSSNGQQGDPQDSEVYRDDNQDWDQ